MDTSKLLTEVSNTTVGNLSTCRPRRGSESALQFCTFWHMSARLPIFRSIRRQPYLYPSIATRRFAHTPSAQPPTSKPKPNKSPSSLKRTASASLPIRANPNPTRGAIQPVYTFATAEKYELTRVRNALPASAIRFEEALWTPVTAGSELSSSSNVSGEAWVFGNGTVVCWGLQEGQSRKFVDDLIQRSKNAQTAPLKHIETEELEFVIDPAE